MSMQISTTLSERQVDDARLAEILAIRVIPDATDLDLRDQARREP